MAFDVQAVAIKFSAWSGKGVTVAHAASRLYAAYLKLEPTTKASIEADVQTLLAEWHLVDAAFNAWTTANPLSKFAAGMQVANSIAKASPAIERIVKDGETVFAADWAVLKPDAELILSTLKGNVAT